MPATESQQCCVHCDVSVQSGTNPLCKVCEQKLDKKSARRRKHLTKSVHSLSCRERNRCRRDNVLPGQSLTLDAGRAVIKKFNSKSWLSGAPLNEDNVYFERRRMWEPFCVDSNCVAVTIQESVKLRRLLREQLVKNAGRQE